MRTAAVAILAWGLALGLSGPAWGAAADDDASVQSARQALRGPVRFPWYNASEDRLQRLDVQPPKDLQNRHSRWQTAPPPNWTMPSWLWTLLEILGWTLLGIVIGLLIYALVRAYLTDGMGFSVGSEEEQAAARQSDVDRLESLPFALKGPSMDFLEEAKRCSEAGDYGQAIVFLYSYQLLQLDRHQVIRLARGKTNRQYLREVRQRAGLSPLLERSMVAFEDVFFGRHRLERARFESCWEQLDAFHQHLEQAAA